MNNEPKKYPWKQKEWKKRNSLIAGSIPEGSRVIDLGAGFGFLESRLRPGCSYVPIDKFKMNDKTIVADFNSGELPDVDRGDIVVVQGLIEYIEKPFDFLRSIKKYAPQLLISYLETDASSPEQERKNYFDMVFFCGMLEETGWNISAATNVGPGQALFKCVSN